MHTASLPANCSTSQPTGPHEVDSSRNAPGITARTTPIARRAPESVQTGLRVERYAVEPNRFLDPQHQVHVLQRVRGLPLHQVVDGRHHDQPLVLRVDEDGDVAHVAAVHRLRPRGYTLRQHAYEGLALV